MNDHPTFNNMKTLICKLVSIFCISVGLALPLTAQELIFRSGFEAGTQIVNQGAQFADIVGVDGSLETRNDWVNDLESHPNVGVFELQYQDLNENQQSDRRAEIVPDPTGSGRGQVLKYWMVDDHVTFERGRIQTNNYGAPEGMQEYYQRMKLYLPSESFSPLVASADRFDFLTILELWNNNNWNPAFGQPGAYPYRIKVNITKAPGSGQPLVFRATGEVQSRPCCWGEGDDRQWQATSDYALPLDTWLDLEVYAKEGDAQNGTFQMAVTPPGGTKQMLIDVTGWTQHPDDPNPDGIRYSNALKMYTNSSSTIDKVVAAGDSLKFYWDDFRLWNGQTIEGAAPGGAGPSCLPPILWDNTPIAEQSSTFTAQWKMTADGTFMNGVVGLSPNPAGAYGELAVIVRFNDQGFIDARDGDTYTATNPVPYVQDVAYRVRAEVDVSARTYDVYATPAGGTEQLVADDFAFRTEQATATQLSYYAINTEECRLLVDDFTILTPDDNTAPTTPTNLTAANVTETTLDLNWTASTDDQGVVKYEVLKDTQWDQSVFGAPPAPQATVTGLTPGTSYIFYVAAFDATGNRSSNSQVVTITTPGSAAARSEAATTKDKLSSLEGISEAAVTVYPNPVRRRSVYRANAELR